MPLPHFALLGQILAEFCDVITIANGYDWERTRVVRTSMSNAVNYENGVIEILEGDPTPESNVNASLSIHPYIGWTQEFLVHVVIIQSQSSTVALVDELGLAAAAVVKAINPSGRLYNQVHTLEIVTLEQFRAAPGEQGGVILHLRATYQTHEDRLDLTPYPPPFGP